DRRVHPAGDLQPGGALEAGLPHRGAAGRACQHAGRSAGRRAARQRRQDHGREGMTAAADTATAAAADVAIDVEGLTKSFDGRTVVRNLTMRVKRGLIYGFLGPNGSGKTTTIRMLCGLLTPDAGRGTCLGFDIRTEAEKIKTRVGYMTQRFSLYDDLSVRENLEFVARIYGIPNPPAAARAAVPGVAPAG